MSSKGFLRAGFCAFSLSVSLVAGCASPVVPTPATGGEVPAPAAQSPTEGTPAGQPAPTAPAPAAITPVTLSGKASFRGEALSGYDVTVLDAQTGKAVERKADLAGVTTLAVLDKNMKTDASGAFSFQVVGLKPGQALRVQIRQGNGLLETIVTSDLQALGAKKMQLLQATAGDGLTINELTTAIAKIARGVLTTTRVLSPEEAAPVLAQLAVEMATLSVKLDAALKSQPSLANNLVSTQSKESEAVNSLVSSAGALKEVTQAVAKLVSQVAKSSSATTSAAAADPTVKAELAKVEFIGTVLTGSFVNSNFSLSNSATGQSVDAASGDVGSVSSNVTGSTGSSSSNSGPTAEQLSILTAIGTDHSNVTTADQKAVLSLLDSHKNDLGIPTATWTAFLSLSGTSSLNPDSGRQQAVAKYLLERIFQRKTGGTAPYTTLSALQNDFAVAVAKEADKRDLINAIKTAADDTAALNALKLYLPRLRADFAGYLLWHNDWNVPNEDWANGWQNQQNYFAQNVSNIDYFVDTPTLHTTVATAVRTMTNADKSDMAILAGLAKGLLLPVAHVTKDNTTPTQLAVLLETHRVVLGLDTSAWAMFLKLSEYTSTGGNSVVASSGRQNAVTEYLIERAFNRKSPAVNPQPYMDPMALRSDFVYAVNKEHIKWQLIVDIAAIKADGSLDADQKAAAARGKLTPALRSIRLDFESFLGWHDDWTVPNKDWANGWQNQTNYFQTNITNIDTYLNGDEAAQLAKATAVLNASTGFSDMAILYGLK
ncbi:hypothetical protein D3C72_710370 [compost metagenome]